MKRHLVLTMSVIMLSFTLLLNLGLCDKTIFDEQFELFGGTDEGYYQDYNYPLISGDTVSINITVTGDPITFGIASSNGYLFLTSNVSSLQKTWSAPYNDTFTFHVANGGASAHSLGHFEMTLVTLVPEYPLTPILPIFITAILLVAISHKRKHPDTETTTRAVRQFLSAAAFRRAILA